MVENALRIGNREPIGSIIVPAATSAFESFAEIAEQLDLASAF
jgi:hypothetical protein